MPQGIVPSNLCLRSVYVCMYVKYNMIVILQSCNRVALCIFVFISLSKNIYIHRCICILYTLCILHIAEIAFDALRSVLVTAFFALGCARTGDQVSIIIHCVIMPTAPPHHPTSNTQRICNRNANTS